MGESERRLPSLSIDSKQVARIDLQCLFSMLQI